MRPPRAKRHDCKSMASRHCHSKDVRVLAVVVAELERRDVEHRLNALVKLPTRHFGACR